jgi:hypothetical protein
VQLVDQRPAVTPPLEEVRDLVAAELGRAAGDRALSARLDQLRKEADVRVREELP